MNWNDMVHRNITVREYAIERATKKAKARLLPTERQQIERTVKGWLKLQFLHLLYNVARKTIHIKLHALNAEENNIPHSFKIWTQDFNKNLDVIHVFELDYTEYYFGAVEMTFKCVKRDEVYGRIPATLRVTR